jgi:aminoglycoside 6'-N-acetyltransferase
MVTRWLQTAEVIRWWGEPEEQLALITEDLDEPLKKQWIVEHAERPFAYIQVYAAGAWSQSHLAHLPDRAQVIDTFIGEPSMLGRGHGSAFLRAMTEKLLAEGAPVVAIDPARDNHRAHRAFVRVGFTEEQIVASETGFAALMLLFAPTQWLPTTSYCALAAPMRISSMRVARPICLKFIWAFAISMRRSAVGRR